MFANLVASELVTMQALTAPMGLVFFMQAIFGTQKGNVNRGDPMYDVLTGPSKNSTYTTQDVPMEFVATGTGALANFAGNLGHLPVLPATIQITDGTQTIVDNGNGNFAGDIGAASTINYATGAYNITFAANVALGATVVATYKYNMEANADIPEVDLVLTSAPVVAEPQKIRARVSLEALQDAKAYHGINAELELVNIMANEIAKDINYTIVNHLETIAASGTLTFFKSPPVGVQYIFHQETFYNALVELGNSIFFRTQRAHPNWIVAGTSVCNIIECLAKFKPLNAAGNTKVAGIRKIGTLGDYDVYKDPTRTPTRALVGYKGSGWQDVGYIYAPYGGPYVSPTITLDDQTSRKSMMQRIGKKPVNPNFYATLVVDETTVPNSDMPPVVVV